MKKKILLIGALAAVAGYGVIPHRDHKSNCPIPLWLMWKHWREVSLMEIFDKMRTLLLILCIGLLVSCSSEKKEIIDSHELKPTGQIKSFELDSNVKYNAFYLYTFKDKDNKEYLSFLNYRTNQLHFYDLTTEQFLFKVDLDSEGPDGVSQISGYYIQDFDNIYVSSYAYSGLIRVDTTGHILQKIPYGKTDKGYTVLPSYTPSSHPYIAPIILGNKIYITQQAVAHFHSVNETPLSVVIDTVKGDNHELPLTYAILEEEELNACNTQFSRIYDGKNFIYSFYVSDDILVTSINHSDIQRIPVKSRYIDSATDEVPDNEQGPRLSLELPRYGDLIYDPYREVYYRFAYPKVSLERNMNWWGKAVYGRKKFSVIILDKEFRIIGETLFPEGIYNSFVFFVHKDGLYMSRDYQMGMGNQSDDYMTFELFKLAQKD